MLHSAADKKRRKARRKLINGKPPKYPYRQVSELPYDEDNHLQDGLDSVPFHLKARGQVTVPTDSYMKPNRNGIKDPSNILTLREQRFTWQKSTSNDIMYNFKGGRTIDYDIGFGTATRADIDKAQMGKPNPDAGPGTYKHGSSLGVQVNSQWRNDLGIKFESTPLPSPSVKTPSPGPSRLPEVDVVSYARGVQVNEFKNGVRFAQAKRRPLNAVDSQMSTEVRYELSSIYPPMRQGVGLAKAERCKMSYADMNRSPGAIYNHNVINFKSGHRGNSFGKSAGRKGPVCNIDALFLK